jgi:hypothetical protein
MNSDMLTFLDKYRLVECLSAELVLTRTLIDLWMQEQTIAWSEGEYTPQSIGEDISHYHSALLAIDIADATSLAASGDIVGFAMQSEIIDFVVRILEQDWSKERIERIANIPTLQIKSLKKEADVIVLHYDKLKLEKFTEVVANVFKTAKRLEDTNIPLEKVFGSDTPTNKPKPSDADFQFPIKNDKKYLN